MASAAGLDTAPDEGPRQENGTDRDKDLPNHREGKESANDSLVNSISSLSEQTSSSSPLIFKRSSTTPLLSSTTSSTTASPKPSREGSPTRPPMKPGIAAATRATNRSRKNSTDLSPHRAPSAPGPSIPTVPSAAAIQRALSAAGTPHLPPPTHHDGTTDSVRPSKGSRPAPSTGSRTGPSNSRVSSPPPSASAGSNKTVANSSRGLERSQSTPTAPTILVERPNSRLTVPSSPNNDNETTDEGVPAKTGIRTPGRGTSGSGPTLDAIEENSQSTKPAVGATRSATGGKTAEKERPEVIEENPMEEALSKETHSKPSESGNESAGGKGAEVKSGEDGKTIKPTANLTTAKPPMVQSKKSFTQLQKGKAPTEGSAKNITVETETVSSIPQVALGGGAVERNLSNRTDNVGSLRLKPSSETIRPKKEKKKVARKAPSLNAGTGMLSSKVPHYYHLHSRDPYSESRLSLSVSSSPGSVFGRWTLSSEPSPRRRSKDRTEQHYRQSATGTVGSGLSSSDSLDFRHRTKTLLIPIRGRPASSKADIFEAKVASAVGEADSSDSEETFVYESNPPEPHSSRPHRMHSRTPSAASTVSQLDYHKARQDGHHSIVGKKSMKFSNNYSTINYANDGEGTVRGPSQAGRGTTSHHHIGRYGRGGGHPSLFDSDSPFPNAKRNTTGHLSHHQSPRQSPRNGHFSKTNGVQRKAEENSSYDLEGEGADDERTPLVSSIRTGRNRRRPLPGSVRQMYASEEPSSILCGPIAGYTLLGSVLALLIAAVVVILIMCTKPLINVHIEDIRNVLASEQEIMLDLHVHAINPNLIAIQVSDLDVNIFAKSKHVGTAAQWRAAHPNDTSSSLLPPTLQSRSSKHKRPSTPLADDPSSLISHLLPSGGVDEGTDPIDDPSSDSHTMLLGQIFSFDSPLVFDPSPIHRRSKGSVGEVRLAKPGNSTEEGGSRRWEQVLQHDFELIVRGVLRYSSPISQTVRPVSIGGSVTVHPSQEDKAGNARLSPPDTRREEVAPGNNVIVKDPIKQQGLRARWFAA